MTAIKSYQFLQLTSAPSSETILMKSFSQADPTPQIQIPKSPSQSKTRVKPVSVLVGKAQRSMSTSNAKGQAASESAPAGSSSADKRRNKLGYHRTSVACGHCRRRKIRCILAPSDAQGRCANCIRLKKECTFYPVDQQPQQESRNPPDAHYEADGASEASSPSAQIEPQRGRQDGLHYPSLTMPSIQDAHMSRPKTGSYSPDDKVYNSPHSYEYARSSSTWESTPIPKSSTSEVFNPGWRIPGESPITPASAYSPYTPNLQHPTHPSWPSIASEPAPREEGGWTLPNRSMSYGTVEGVPLPSSYSYHHASIAPRVSETTYAPPLTASASSPASSVGTNAVPLEGGSRPGQPAFSIPAWQPYAYGKPPSSSAEPYGGGAWYGTGVGEHNQANLGDGNDAGMYYPNASQAGR